MDIVTAEKIQRASNIKWREADGTVRAFGTEGQQRVAEVAAANPHLSYQSIAIVVMNEAAQPEARI